MSWSSRQSRVACFCGIFALAGTVLLGLYLSRQTDFLLIKEVQGSVLLTVRDPMTGREASLAPRPRMVHDADCRITLGPESRIVISVLDRGRLVVEAAPGLTSLLTQQSAGAAILLFKQRSDWWRLESGRAWLVSDEREDGDTCRDLRFDLDTSATELRAGGVLRLGLTLHRTNAVVRTGGALADAPLLLVPSEAPQTLRATAGLDCMLLEGETRLAIWTYGLDGSWYMRAWRLPIQKFAANREAERLLARRARPFPGSAYPPAPRDWWQRWLDKKNEILAEGKPERDYWRLQKIYRQLGKRPSDWAKSILVPMTRFDRVSSPFGLIRYITSTNGRAHRGIDFASPEGVDVIAPMDGRVVFAYQTGVNGQLVILDHGEGVFSSFMHLSRVLARSNTVVSAGTVVGRVGTTGLSTGPHLHYEMRVGNRCVDPTPWFLASPIAGQVDWIRLPE